MPPFYHDYLSTAGGQNPSPGSDECCLPVKRTRRHKEGGLPPHKMVCSHQAPKFALCRLKWCSHNHRAEKSCLILHRAFPLLLASSLVSKTGTNTRAARFVLVVVHVPIRPVVASTWKYDQPLCMNNLIRQTYTVGMDKRN